MNDDRRFAVDLFNEVWALLETTDRTPEQDERMIHAAHGSRLHWEAAGTAENMAVGDWLCSRVYAVLGRAEPALYHARWCLTRAGVRATCRTGSAPKRTKRWPGSHAWLVMPTTRGATPRKPARSPPRSRTTRIARSCSAISRRLPFGVTRLRAPPAVTVSG